MNYKPKVSVIIPTFNRPKKTLRAIESVFAQAYRDYELIVVNDGSSCSYSEVEKILKNNNAYYYFFKERNGVSYARNYGVSKSKGEWISFLDSDDFWFPEKLQKQMEYHLINKNYFISQTEEEWIRNGVRVNPKKKHKKPFKNAFSSSLELCVISPSSVIIKKEIFDLVGGFDTRLTVCEDYDLWLRITFRYKLGLVKDILVRKYGGHEDQLSKSVYAMDRFRVFSIVKLIGEENLKGSEIELAIKALIKKMYPLIVGAKKRNKDKIVFLYEELDNFCKEALRDKKYKKIKKDFLAFQKELSFTLENF